MPFGRTSRLVILSAGLSIALWSQTDLTVSPTEVGLALPVRSTTPATAIIAVTTPPGQTASYTAVVTHLGGTPNWLSVNPASGPTPANLTLTANASALDAGTYQAQIAIAAQPSGIRRVVNVALRVGSGGGTGSFGVSPAALTFLSQSGLELAPQTITITSPAQSTGFRVVPTSSGWLTVTPLDGVTPGTVTVQVFPAGLPSGRYEGSVSIYPLSGGPPNVVPVTLMVSGIVDDRLLLSQSRLHFNYENRPGSLAPGQVFSVNVPSLAARPFAVTTNTPWLVVPAQTGTTGEAVAVYLDIANLPDPGTHSGTVTLSSPNLPNVELPVTLTVTTQPTLNVVPSSLVLNDLYQMSVYVTVYSTSSSLSFTASTSTTTGGNWLSVTPNQGSTATALLISANTTGLPPATYTGSVVLTANNGTTFTIPVRLEIAGAAPGGALMIVPAALTLKGVPGGPDPIEVLAIGADSEKSHPFTISAISDGGWLAVQTTSGTTPARVGVTARLANLSPGVRAGSLQITSLLTGAQYTVPVELQLLEEALSVEPASIEFVQPRRGVEPPPVSLQVNSPVPVRFEIREKPDWVRISQPSGTTPATLQLWATVSAAPPGTNSVVRIIGPANEVSIPVAFRAADPAAATVTPANVTLRYSVGQPVLPTETLTIESGGEPGPFTVAVATESGGEWLLATPASGTTPGTVQLSIDPLLLAPGRYAATVTINVNNGAAQTRTVPVELMVGSPSATVESVLHAAALAPTAVAPGQVITILGTGLGPLLPVTPRPTSAGAYDTRVADTRVLFDGTPAPILYLKNDQINAIVPYSVFGRVSTTMRIEQGSNWSLPLQLRVADSSPGIFTSSGTGRGQAAAVNEDSSQNSPSNPAARGSVISLYVTGEGQTDPPGNDGRIIMTDIRRPVLPVTARVGGQPAEVLYAGSAPMQVSGMTQVNIRIPENVTPGVVPLEIQVGQAVSQSAVTISVH